MSSARPGRFEKGAHLAFMLDLDRGYRDGTSTEWTVVPIQKLPGGKPSLLGRAAKVQLDSFLSDQASGLPSVTVAPGPEQTVKVTSSLGLVVQDYGDTVPRATGSTGDEVAYGSIVRAGPVLLAPLYAEQAISLKEGRLHLPVIGGGAELEPARESVTQLEAAAEKEAKKLHKSRIPLALLLFFVLGGAAYGLYSYLKPKPLPRHVLVVVEVVSDEPREVAENILKRGLEFAGFAPKVYDGPSRNIRDLAHEQLTGHVIVARYETEPLREGLKTGNTLFDVHASVKVFSLESESFGERHAFSMASEDASAEEAVSRRGRYLMEVLSHAVVSDLLGTEVEDDFFGDLAGLDRRGAIEARHRALAALKARNHARRNYDTSCDQAAQKMYTDRSPIDIHYLTDPCDEEYPIGVAGDGSFAVVHVETLRPYFPLEEPCQPHGSYVLERLEIVPLSEEGQRQTLAVANNYVSFGTLSRDSSTVAVVEHVNHEFGLVTLDVATKARAVVHRQSDPLQLAFPKVSPDGSQILVWRQNNRGRDRVPLLVNAPGGEVLELAKNLIQQTWVEVPTAEGGPPAIKIAAVLAPEPSEDGSSGPQQLVLLSPQTGQIEKRFELPQGEISRVVGSLNDQVVFAWRGQGRGVGQWHPVTGESQVGQTPVRLNRPIIAFERIIGAAYVGSEWDEMRGDSELVAVDPATADTTVITANVRDERYIRGTPSVSRIVAGRVLPSHYRHLPRAAVYWVDLQDAL